MDAHTNFAYTTLASPPSGTAGTELTVASGTGTLFPTAPFNATIWPADAAPLSSNAEIVRVTAKSVDTFTITRAQEGSTARTFLTNCQMAAGVTKKVLTDIEYGAHGIINVKDPVYGATGDGVTDDTAAIQAAETARALVDGILLFPAPSVAYKIATAVAIGSNGVIDARAAKFVAGTQSTSALFTIAGTGGTTYALTGNTTEGALTCELSEPDAANFAADDHVLLYDNTTVSSADYVRERNIVEGVSGTTVTFKYPLNWAYLTANSATLRKVTPAQNMTWLGGEFDLTGTTGEVDAIQCNYGFNVRVSDVKGTAYTGKVVQFWDGLDVHAERITGTYPSDVSAGHGYGTQLIYCRHSSLTDTYVIDGRHIDDVTGGSDITVTRSKGVAPAATMTAGVFTHGLGAKRVTIVAPNVSGASQGVAIGTSGFVSDYDVTIVSPQTFRCSDAIGVTTSERVRVVGGNAQDSLVRGVAVSGGVDVDVDDLTIDGILSNPSNYGALDVSSSSDRVKVSNTRIRNAHYKSVRLTGSGDLSLENCEVDHSGTATAVDATSVTGRIRVKGGTYLNRTASVDTISISGATSESIVEGIYGAGVGVEPSSIIKILGAPTVAVVQGNYVKGASEGIRVENVVGPRIAGNTLDTCGNGIRLVTPMTYVDFGGGNAFVNITTNPVVNSPAAKIVQGLSANRGDASVTLIAGQDCESQLFDTELTQARTCTVSLTANQRIHGQRYRIVRGPNATGAFDLTVRDATPTTLKVLAAAGEWCDVQDQGAAGIVLIGSGTL